MSPMGRRGGAWRCPTCRAIFLDTEAMRRGRPGALPVWAPVVMSVLVSVGATVLTRALKKRLARTSTPHDAAEQ